MRDPSSGVAQAMLGGMIQFEGTWDFGDWIVAQAALQVAAEKGDPKDLCTERSDGTLELTEVGAAFLIWNHSAAVCELGEAMDEMGWKPWATSRHVNRAQFVGEIVDALHFLGNMLRLVDCTGRELTMAYQAKQAKNLKRWQEGYDGVSGKCPTCHRDLGEVGVTVLSSPSTQRQERYCKGCGARVDLDSEES